MRFDIYIYIYIQGDSGVVNITVDVFLGLCDQKKSSYKQMSDSERLQDYDLCN